MQLRRPEIFQLVSQDSLQLAFLAIRQAIPDLQADNLGNRDFRIPELLRALQAVRILLQPGKFHLRLVEECVA